MITIENIEMMSEEDFQKLGITAIGIRIRIKQACRNFLKAKEASPVVQKYIDMQGKKKRKVQSNGRRNVSKNEKKTRRVYLGWKHGQMKDVYKVVTTSKGGGQQILDISKDSQQDELIQQIVNVYFPSEKSAGGLFLKDLNYYVASFSGMLLPTLEETGGFTVGKYFQHVNTYPVRLYLHTYVKDETSIEEDKEQVLQDNILPIIGPPRQRARLVSRTVNQEPVRQSCHTVSELECAPSEDSSLMIPVNNIDNMGLSLAQLRSDQNTAYAISLLADQQKDLERKAEQEKHLQEQQQIACLQQLRAQRRSVLTIEPKEGLLLKFRLASGRIVQRHFSADSDIQVVVNFLGSLEESSEYFDVVPPHGPPICLKAGTTIADIGVAYNTLFHVKWLSKAEETKSAQSQASAISNELETVDDDVIFQETDTPTIQFRNHHRNRLALSGRRERVTSRNCTVNSMSGGVETVQPTQRMSGGLETEQLTQTASAQTEQSPQPATAEMTQSTHYLTQDAGLQLTAAEQSDVDEELDENIRKAIEESLELMAMPKRTLVDVLKWWVAITKSEGSEQELLIQRGKILTSTKRAISRATFCFTKPIKIMFSGEDGEDLGGPKREFFRELMKEVQKDILTGPDGNQVFKHDLNKLVIKDFELAGKLVAWSLLHGGPGIPVFNSAVYELMTDGKDVCVDLTVLDPEIRTILEEISQCSTKEEFNKKLQENFDWLSDQGVVIHAIQFEEKDKLVKNLFKNAVFYRVHSEFADFSNGLNYVGQLYQQVRNAPDVMKKLFVNMGDEKPTFRQLRSMYKINFSPPDSNLKRKEEDAVYCFELFLKDCEGGMTDITLEDVLVFWTGAKTIPPLGFETNLEVSFVSSELNRLPVSHTCGMVMELNRGITDPDKFQEQMVKAVTWSGGFHLV